MMQMELFDPGRIAKRSRPRRDVRNGYRADELNNVEIAHVVGMPFPTFMSWFGTSYTTDRRVKFYYVDEIAAVASVWHTWWKAWKDYEALDETEQLLRGLPPLPRKANGHRMYVVIPDCIDYVHSDQCADDIRERYESTLAALPPIRPLTVPQEAGK